MPTVGNSWRMARQKLPENKKARNAGISLPPALIRKARKLAYSQNMSLAGLVRSLLTTELEKSK